MMPAAVKSAFDVAMWFADRARVTGCRIQPMALQQMLFLSQAWFAATHGGRAMMPALFVADELGPLEPNVHAAFSRGHPALDLDGPLPVAVETILEKIWRGYGRMPATSLLRLTTAMPAYTAALARGRRAPISLEEMRASAHERLLPQEPEPAPALQRRLRTQDGRSVRIAAWTPHAKPSADPGTA